MSHHDHSHKKFRQREHIGPYTQNRFLVFNDVRPGAYTFNEILPSQLTLDILLNSSMTVFKLPSGRACIVTIEEANSSGTHSFEVMLLPNPRVPETTKTDDSDKSEASKGPGDQISICRDNSCEPYEIDCTFPKVPSCETKIDEHGNVRTVMVCVDPPQPANQEKVLPEEEGNE